MLAIAQLGAQRGQRATDQMRAEVSDQTDCVRQVEAFRES
jgi:hypothetical protein